MENDLWKNMSQLNWLELLVEVIVSVSFEAVLLFIFGLWLIYKGRRALREGRFDHVVLFSFNLIDRGDDGQSAPTLAFRTPLSSTLAEIFQSEALVKEIESAARKVTEEKPVIQLARVEDHNLMQRQLINYCNLLNREGLSARLAGKPCHEKSLRLALVYEPGAQAKMFRIIPVDDSLFNDLDEAGDQLRFSLPYHRDRVKTLNAIRIHYKNDLGQKPENRVLAPFKLTVSQ